MNPSAERLPYAYLWGLGLTQIVGYGTLYYSFSILAPDMARDFDWPLEWIFGVFSAGLLLSGFFAPTAGKLADKYGAGRVMAIGSVMCALTLLACAAAPNVTTWAILIVILEVGSTFVLYAAAFVAIVQGGGRDAQRSIVHLTLIGGFASTLFWPLTSYLQEAFDWREIYAGFAVTHIVLCLPVHAAIARHGRSARNRTDQSAEISGQPMPATPLALPGVRRLLLALMLTGFALEGLVLSSVLVHMVPLTQALGMGAAGLLVASIFGPAQVASRFTNMLFGGRLRQAALAVIATLMLPAALLILVITAPAMAGGILFAALFGFGSGLNSIVGGTLPLELFGRQGYGALLGRVTAARQVAAALAPFGLALAMTQFGVKPSLVIAAVAGLGGVICFLTILLVARRMSGSPTIPSGLKAEA